MPLIATNCISNDDLYPAYDTTRFVDDETYRTWFRGHPKPGDLLFVLKGTPGRVCMVPDPVDFCIAQDMVALRPDSTKVLPQFLFALLRSPEVQHRIAQLHVGSLIPHFKKGDFDKLVLEVPDPVTQGFVGEMYMAFSSKIEINRRRSQTLTRLRATLFDAWYQSLEGARQPLGDLVSVIRGVSYSGRDMDAAGVAMITLGCFRRDGTFNPEGIRRYSGRFQPTQILVPDTDVVVANTDITQDRAVLGSPALVPATTEPILCSHHVSILRAKAPRDGIHLFLFGLLDSKEFRARAAGFATGTTVLALPKDAITNYRVHPPSHHSLDALAREARPLSEGANASLQQSVTLAKLRDMILTGLLPGRLTLREAQVRTEAAV